MNSFSPILLDQRDLYYSLWDATPSRSIDYTLANLFGWKQYYRLEWSLNDDLIWIRQNRSDNGPIYWAPVGDWEHTDWQSVFADTDTRTFIRVPERLMQIWTEQMGDRVSVLEDRGQWEYLYTQSDLATLPGRNYHKKKTHYSNFIKEYGTPDYQSMNNLMVEDVLALQDEWCQWHECEDSSSLKAENEAINQVLSHWTIFRGLIGGAIYISDRIVAFSIGEQLDHETLGVHYEKGLNGFKGIYQTINREFSARVPDGITLLNRAQDLDEEGLRKAKMTYHPCGFLKKYTCTITR